MSYEAIIAFATVGQLVVIVVAAGAAFRQIRHMRAANQWAGVMHVIEMYKSDQFYDALDCVQNEHRSGRRTDNVEIVEGRRCNSTREKRTDRV